MVSRELRSAILAALFKRPEKRIATVEEILKNPDFGNAWDIWLAVREAHHMTGRATLHNPISAMDYDTHGMCTAASCVCAYCNLNYSVLRVITLCLPLQVIFRINPERFGCQGKCDDIHVTQPGFVPVTFQIPVRIKIF